MATGRTTPKWTRLYVDGYDLSGYGRTVGPLTWEYDFADLTAQMSDAVKGGLPNLCNISPGVFNGVMQSTTDSGVEVSRIQLPGVQRDIMVAQGIRADPATGDPVFMCKSSHSGFNIAEDGGAMTVNATFGGWDASDLINYQKPWGVLLHPKGEETISGQGTQIDNGAATAAGCYMQYQFFSGDIAGTLYVYDSSDGGGGGDWAAITDGVSFLGASSISIPSAGISVLPVTQAVRRYITWVLTVTSGTSLTFSAAFVRG
jgi:hypothetical protein